MYTPDFIQVIILYSKLDQVKVSDASRLPFSFDKTRGSLIDSLSD